MPFNVTIEKEADIASLSPSDVRKAIAERSEMLHKIFEEAGQSLDPSKVTVVQIKDGLDLASQIDQRNQELSLLGKRLTDIDRLEGIREENERRKAWADNHPKDPQNFAPIGEEKKGSGLVAVKSIGQFFVESQLLEHAKAHGNRGMFTTEIDGKAWLEQKAVMSTSAGWAPESTRTGRLILDEQRPIEITDILPVFPTSQALIKYMEETTFTNAAAERAEGAAYAEGTLVLTERSDEVESVGVSLPVTDEQLEDIDGIRSYLDQRLTFMVRQRLDSQILAGDGNTPNLLGTYNKGSIQTQAKGADTTMDAFYKAITKVRVTGRAQPNAAIMHPNDWQDIQLLKTTDGVYIWGNPSSALPDRLWGLPVIATTAATENTGIVGDYARFSGLHVRRGMDVQTGYVNDDFLDGRVTIRAGLRVAVVHYRPGAFCTVTGI